MQILHFFIKQRDGNGGCCFIVILNIVSKIMISNYRNSIYFINIVRMYGTVLPLIDIPSLVSNGICEVGLLRAILKNELLPMMMISSNENAKSPKRCFSLM